MLTSSEHPRWLWHSRNKRSLGLDLRQNGARDVLLRLVETADVVIEGFAPGVAAKLGLDYASLTAVNGRLVYASVTGFGQFGPNAALPGHEMNYQAMGGVIAATAAAARAEPRILPFPLSDSVASLYATIGILAALRRRDATGRGAVLDVSIQDSVISLLGYPAQYYWRDGIDDPLDVDEFGGSPASAPYATSDGRAVVLGAVEPGQWSRFRDHVGHPDLGELDTVRDRADEVRTLLTELFCTRTRQEWLEAAAGNALPLAPVLSMAELLEDDHVRSRGMVGSVEHPDLGPVPQVSTPILVDGEVTPMTSLAVPGSDTSAVLDDLGISANEVAALHESGAVFDSEPRPRPRDT